ncbi:MAG TPA: HNH endonuclease [Trebonia sp.]
MQFYVHARRAAMAGVGSEKFLAAEIFERDGWKCWICGLTATRDPAKGDPMGATMDHVVPISKGGAHTRANVRCAHLICNLKKGDRIVTGPSPITQAC